jgi:putative transposase
VAAVGKNYQNEKIDASELAVPESVGVALGEIAADMREGLLALVVGAGLWVMASMMEADVAAVAGLRGRHDPARTAAEGLPGGCDRLLQV